MNTISAEQPVHSQVKIFREDTNFKVIKVHGVYQSIKFNRDELFDFIRNNCVVYHYTNDKYFKENYRLKYCFNGCYVFDVYDDGVQRQLIEQHIFCPSYSGRQKFVVSLKADEVEQTKDSHKRSWVGVVTKELNKIIREVEEQYKVTLTIPVPKDAEEKKKQLDAVKQGEELIYNYHNKNYNGKKTKNVYGYDINSAYTTALMEMKDKLVWSGNKEADAVFSQKLLDLCLKWYEKKKSSVGEERNKYKFYLNIIIGQLRNVNVKAWAQLLTYHTNKMKELVKQVTNPILYAYTDSIYTIGKCDFLESLNGIELGQFKLEHADCTFSFNYAGTAYQVDQENPKWKGVDKTEYLKFQENYGRQIDITSMEDIRMLNKLKNYVKGV